MVFLIKKQTTQAFALSQPMDDRISSVQCRLTAPGVDLLTKAFPCSVFAKSLFWHHRSLHCRFLGAADSVYLHYVSKDRLPSILRQECPECFREAHACVKRPAQANEVYTVVLDTKLDYQLNGVFFKDGVDMVHGFLTCPILRTGFPEPIPLELVPDHRCRIACAACLSLD